MLIDKPGVFTATLEEYLADPCPEPSVSSHHARTLVTKSPAHAWIDSKRLNPNHESKDKTVFDIGSAFHAALTGVGNSIVLIHADSFRGKAAQEQRDEARGMGLTPLLAKDWERVQAMVQAAREQLRATEFGDVFDGDPLTCEVNMAWQSDGCWNRARADKLQPEKRIQFDVKSTTDVAEQTLIRRVRDLGYDIGRAHYQEGVKATFGPGWRHVYVFVETAPPHALRVVELPGDWDSIAGAKLARAREMHRWCLDHVPAGEMWPGYPAETLRPSMPDWHETNWVFQRDADRHTREQTGKDALARGIRFQSPIGAAA